MTSDSTTCLIVAANSMHLSSEHANTGKTVKEVTNAMSERITRNPEEAKAWGLVHEIKPELVPAGFDVTSIQFPA